MQKTTFVSNMTESGLRRMPLKMYWNKMFCYMKKIGLKYSIIMNIIIYDKHVALIREVRS